MTLKNKIIMALIITLLMVACVAAIYAWYQERNKPPISKIEYVKVPEIRKVREIQRVEVPVEKIVTIEKQVIVEKLKLPEWFAEDQNKQAVATAEIQPYEGKTNAVATIDTKTGVGEIIVKQEPLSFLGLPNEKEIYAKIGYTTDKETEAILGGRWLFGRVGRVKVGFYGEGRTTFATNQAETSGAASAGIIITY
jgi:predicted aconitase with swiveling domain